MANFLDIKSENLIDYTLKLQKINDVALPIAVQNTLNSVVRGVKYKYLKETTNKMFSIKRKSFFTANSRFNLNNKNYKAKQFGYNINKLNANVGIIKNKKPHEKATEQVGNQQTATNIKRSINPLGKKPVRKNVVDVLNKKPEIYDYANEGGFNANTYYKKAGRAKKRNAPFIVANRGRGRVNQVKSMNRFKSGKRKGKINMKLLAIGSYIKDGEVKLTKKRPFLNKATEIAMNNMLEKEFIKEADRQFKRAMKK